MNGDRFDELSRLLARLGDRALSRRSALRALLAGTAVATLDAAPSDAAPADRRARIRARNQQTGIDALIDEVAFALEYDQTKIVSFVRDEIGYDPYAGALRGPIGTIWAGAGNSVDKAQLLSALLSASLITSRYVSGSLSGEQATALAAAPRVTSPPPVVNQAMTRLVNAAQATPQSAEPNAELATQLNELRDELMTATTTRVADDSRTITELLSEAGVLAPAQELSLPDRERNEHFWLQVANGANWDDIDVTGALTTNGSVAAPSEVNRVDTNDQSLFHWITVRMTADVVAGGEVQRVTLNEQRFPSQNLVNQPFALFHIDSAGKSELGFDLTGTLEGVKYYYPSILGGADVYFGDVALTFGGQGGVLDALSEPTGNLPDGEGLAEFLELEIASPDGRTLITRRTIFDRLAEQRGSESVDLTGLVPVELTDLGEEGKHFLPMTDLFAMAAVSGNVPDGFRLLPSSGDADYLRLSNSTRGMQVTRQGLLHAIGTPATGVVDRPNLFCHVYSLARDDNGAYSAITIRSDLLAQSSIGSSESADSQYGIVAGVAAQRAEELAFSPKVLDFVQAQVGNLGVTVRSGPTVGRITDTARETGKPLRVFRSASDLEAFAGAFPGIARALVEEHIANGLVIVAPSAPVQIDGAERTGWWVYDPQTGSLFDQLADGTGGALLYSTMAEYALKLKAAALAAKIFIHGPLGTCIAAILNAVSDIMSPKLIVSATAMIIFCT